MYSNFVRVVLGASRFWIIKVIGGFGVRIAGEAFGFDLCEHICVMVSKSSPAQVRRVARGLDQTNSSYNNGSTAWRTGLKVDAYYFTCS